MGFYPPLQAAILDYDIIMLEDLTLHFCVEHMEAITLITYNFFYNFVHQNVYFKACPVRAFNSFLKLIIFCHFLYFYSFCTTVVTLDEVITHIGYGRFQIKALLISGFTWVSVLPHCGS